MTKEYTVPPAEYLRSDANNLSDDFKATLVKVAGLMKTADGVTADAERAFPAELADALAMSEVEVGRALS